VNCNLSFGELKPFFSFLCHNLRLPPLLKMEARYSFGSNP
jgi:hypothetical protein